MGRTGLKACMLSRKRPGWFLCRLPPRRNSTGMPRMAIDAGLADVVAPAEELPGKIIAHLKHLPLFVRHDDNIADKDESALKRW